MAAKHNITQEDLTLYESVRQHGDIPKMVAATGICRSKLYQILQTGECSRLEAAKVSKFFRERLNAIKAELDQD